MNIVFRKSLMVAALLAAVGTGSQALAGNPHQGQFGPLQGQVPYQSRYNYNMNRNVNVNVNSDKSIENPPAPTRRLNHTPL